jgi:hypothetical protein
VRKLDFGGALKFSFGIHFEEAWSFGTLRPFSIMADTEKQAVERLETGNQTPPESLPKAEKIDTIHQDEALKVLAGYSGDATWTPEEEKKLVRKIDRKLISLLCITYGLQYYDKAMLSQAVSISIFYS